MLKSAFQVKQQGRFSWLVFWEMILRCATKNGGVERETDGEMQGSGSGEGQLGSRDRVRN
jgi:hypothetical protein